MTQEPPLNPGVTQFSDDGQTWWDGGQWIPRDQVPARQAELEREAAAQLQRDQADYAARYAEWQQSQQQAQKQGTADGNPFATPGTPGTAPPPPPPGLVTTPPVLAGPRPTGYALGIWSFVASLLGIGFAAVALGHVSRSQARKAGLRPNVWSRVGLVLGYLDIVAGIAFGALLVWASSGALDDKGPVGQSLTVAGQAEQIYHDHYGTYAPSMVALSPTGYHPAQGVTVVVLRADGDAYCLRARMGSQVLYLASATGKVSRRSCA